MKGVTLGSFTLYTLETGRFALDGGAMFGIVPRTLWEKKIKPDDQNRIPLSLRNLLIETGDRLILIDCGVGSKYDTRFRDIYRIEPGEGLDGALKTCGFAASDVTDILLTHLHFDHCGGGTVRKGETLSTAFENATYHVQKEHWEWAIHPNGREKASFLPENLLPLQESGQLRFTSGTAEWIPGIEVIVINGHTHAQQMVRVTDAGRSLVFVADLLPTTAHLTPAWIMGYDVRPLVSLDEKLSFLERATNEHWTLFYEHDPATVISDVRREGERFVVFDERNLEDL